MTALTKAEVLAKCTPAQIASRDHAAMAATISVARTAVEKIAVLDVKAYLHSNNLWVAIKSAQSDAAKSANGRAAAAALVEFANSGVPNMDVTLPVIGFQLGLLVADAVITQANKDAIIGMGTVPDPVTPFDVAVALEGV